MRCYAQCCNGRPWRPTPTFNTHTFIHRTSTHTASFFSNSHFSLHLVPSPQRPEYISTSTHFVLVSGLHGASCFMWPFSPPLPPWRESRASGHWITRSVCLCERQRKRFSREKGTGRIKGDESTDISWRLLLQSKWRMVLFVLIHLINPLPPPSISAPHHPCCSSHAVFTSHHQIRVRLISH